MFPYNSGQFIYNIVLTVFQIKSLFLCHCAHILHMLLNIYACHIANMSLTAIMLNGHIDHFLHICAKTLPTAISTSHINVVYVPKLMPLKSLICKLDHVQMRHLYLCICLI